MSLETDIQEVGRVLDSLEEFGAEQGIDPGQALRFGLVLDELITNIISYGLAGRQDGVIRLVIDCADGILSAELADNGPPFDPLASEPDVVAGSIEDRPIGGLGLTIVKNVLDRLDYSRVDGFNRVTMEMKLKAA